MGGAIIYYQIRRDELQAEMRVIFADKAEEILEALDELGVQHGINQVLPYYELLKELALMGEPIGEEQVINYYDLFSKTFEYNGQMLSNAIRALKYSLSRDVSMKEMNRMLPWYYRLWFTIKGWFTKTFKRH